MSRARTTQDMPVPSGLLNESAIARSLEVGEADGDAVGDGVAEAVADGVADGVADADADGVGVPVWCSTA
jgi:hypothetical protein